MIERQLKFLDAVLGAEGSSALSKAMEESSALNSFLIPRTIISWIGHVGEFNGNLPGIDDLSVVFAKSESGFTGNVGSHEFVDKSLTHLTALVSMSIGVDGNCDPTGKSMDLEKLGKSLDLLVKNKKKEKKVEKALEVSEEDKDKLEKVAPDSPVKDAAPVAPQAPLATDKTPATKPPKLPKAGATVSLNRSEMNHACPMCAGKQFEGDEFVGCVCFQDLAKSVETLMVDELGTVIHISEDLATITTLLESMGRA